MDKIKAIQIEIANLYIEGTEILKIIADGNRKNFKFKYQSWYTRCLKVVELLAPDRYFEFKSYYEINPKREDLGYGNYVIQDFFKGVAPAPSRYPKFNTIGQVAKCMNNQLAIFNSILDRQTSIFANLQSTISAEIQDNELHVANDLLSVNIRAAGALTGVIIESHLQMLIYNHSIKIGKKNPTIADLNDQLKIAGLIDIPTWRKISFLADIRNICTHKKSADPTKEQVTELIEGANWLIKNIF